MREVLPTRNRAFGPNGVPTTSRQTSATRTDTTSRLPISLGSTNKRYEPSTHLGPSRVSDEESEERTFADAEQKTLELDSFHRASQLFGGGNVRHANGERVGPRKLTLS